MNPRSPTARVFPDDTIMSSMALAAAVRASDQKQLAIGYPLSARNTGGSAPAASLRARTLSDSVNWRTRRHGRSSGPNHAHAAHK